MYKIIKICVSVLKEISFLKNYYKIIIVIKVVLTLGKYFLIRIILVGDARH